MTNRRIPDTDIELSSISWGTMRLKQKHLSIKDVSYLAGNAVDLGIDTFHVSSEYDSYNLLIEALKKMPNSQNKSVKYICKLANPHFGGNSFDAVRLKQSVERYLLELNTDRIDVLQWMWRIKPFNDDLRCALFEDTAEELAESFESLLKEGKVGAVSCFPYSKEFMSRVRGRNLAQGQVNYLNLSQRDALECGLGSYTIALRGACVGDLQGIKNYHGLSLSEFNDPYRMVYRFPLLSPNVVTSVIGLNNLSHMELASSLLDTAPDEKEFQRYVSSRWNEFDMK